MALIMAVGMFIGQKLPRTERLVRVQQGSPKSSELATTLQEILGYIETHYVDSVDLKTIKAETIRKVLENLDPHSVYISPEEIAQVQEDMKGNFEGIGIEFLVVDDTIRVITPLPGGPSESVGIMPGDKIVTINDSIVAGVKIENKEIFDKLRGEKGTSVDVGIRRRHEQKLRSFTITRDVIPVNSLETAYMLDDNTGYIKISRFSARTQEEFMTALKPLVEKEGLKNLVLDLRGNPGGFLVQAVDMLSQFFDDGKLLVYTEGLREDRIDYKSTGRARFKIDNIAVLIDEGSASASEIVAGAIQDHDRGWIIGRRSFGKGLVQEQYPLRDGGALRLTVTRYYTPSGRSIQRDYSNRKQYSHEADRRYENGELSDSTKVKLSDSTEYFTGMGRIVYGGGGIMPDIFIPLDTSFANDFYYEARGQIPFFAANWLDSHTGQKIPNTENMDRFIRNFKVDQSMFNEFLNYLKKEDVQIESSQVQASRQEINKLIKARLAKMLFNDEGLYKFLNSDDPAIEKAWQLMRKGKQVASER